MDRCDSSAKTLHVLKAIALLFFLILAIYSNTFYATWQFDDKPNIVDNQLLHIKNLKSESLFQTFFTDPHDPWNPGEKLYRPIAFLTFAINWYFGQDKVFGYHIVNLLIHVLTAVFLYLTILNLLKAPNLIEKYDRNKCFIAFIAAALWAINPLQTQAVTYIVQRMASMAAMFYIMSILFYIMSRFKHSSLQRILLLLGSIVCFLLALGSKENAAVLPAAVLLIEVTCFQNINWQHRTTAYWVGSILVGVIVFFASIWLFMSQIFSAILKGYEYRPFTFAERLLTEPRILLYHLSQIFYPVPTRLSVEHDVVVSTSLLQPWTTLPAILLISSFIGFGFCQIHKRPIIALAILFFFLNHIIESTIIPLELIFEHRNYLPSLFLFLPVAAGFKWLYDHFKVENRTLTGALVGFLVLLIVGLSAGTYIRNSTWATEFSLWQDAMQKAPQSTRPLTNLAWQMAYGPNARPSQFDAALKLYEKALLLQKPRAFSEPIIMNNMSGIYFRKGEHQKAIHLLERALAISPDYTRGRYDFAQILMATGNWNEASRHIDYLLAKHEVQDKYLNAKGLILIHQKRYNEAIEYFKRALKNFYQFRLTSMYLGVAFSLNGQFSQAERILNQVLQISRDNMLPLLCLIENSIRAEDIPRAKEYARILFDNFAVTAIMDQLENLSKEYMSPPLSPVLISSIVEIRSEK